jgi:hypothetical protein
VGENAASAGELPATGGHLPDDAVVVRGGEMGLEKLIETAAACERKLGYPGFSVYSWPGMTAHEIALKVKEIRDRTGVPLLRNAGLRQSTAGRIRDAGAPERHPFGLVKTFGEGHYTLSLPSPTTSENWELLRDHVFDPVEFNPVGGRA